MIKAVYEEYGYSENPPFNFTLLKTVTIMFTDEEAGYFLTNLMLGYPSLKFWDSENNTDIYYIPYNEDEQTEKWWTFYREV